MTLTFGLGFPFIILTVVKTALGYGSQYMYSAMEPEEFWPVKEYAAAVGATTKGNFTPPTFLTNRSTRNRVVEFYAPWCPHCQHYKQHYIDLARNCTAMAKGFGVDVDFHAVSCTANSDACKHVEIFAYPTIMIYRARNGTGTKVTYSQLHCFTALRIFGVDLPDQLDEPITPKPVVVHNGDQGTLKKIHDGRTKKQIYDDAFLSFDFAMRNSVFMSNGPLANTTAEVFEDWIELLKSTLPFTWKLQNAINSIDNHLEDVVKNETSLVAIMDEHGPSTKTWSPGCPVGYTCGLWELFHIISIGMVEWNRNSFGEDSIFTAEAAADTLHDYISEFFACDVCRRHFIQDYAGCKHDRCNRLGNSVTNLQEWKQFPLWLWEAHNDVRVRLMHEQAQRDNRPASKADEIAVQWPSRDDCPMCWHTDGSWDDEIIYKYIRVTYWIEDAMSAEYRRDLKRHNDERLLELRGDDSYDVKQKSRMPFIVASIVVFGMIFIGLACNKAKKARTGRHKKIDLPSGNC